MNFADADQNQSLSALPLRELVQKRGEFAAQLVSIQSTRRIQETRIAQLRQKLQQIQTAIATQIETAIDFLLPDLSNQSLLKIRQVFPDEKHLYQTDWRQIVEQERAQIEQNAVRVARRYQRELTKAEFLDAEQIYRAVYADFQAISGQINESNNVFLEWTPQDEQNFQTLLDRKFDTADYAGKWYETQFWVDKSFAKSLRKKFGFRRFAAFAQTISERREQIFRLRERLEQLRVEGEYRYELSNLRVNSKNADRRVLEHARVLLRRAFLDSRRRAQTNSKYQQLFDDLSALKNELDVEQKIVDQTESQLAVLIAEENAAIKRLKECENAIALKRDAKIVNKAVGSSGSDSASFGYSSTFGGLSDNQAAINFGGDASNSGADAFANQTETAFGSGDFGGGGSGGSWENFS